MYTDKTASGKGLKLCLTRAEAGFVAKMAHALLPKIANPRAEGLAVELRDACSEHAWGDAEHLDRLESGRASSAQRDALAAQAGESLDAAREDG